MSRLATEEDDYAGRGGLPDCIRTFALCLCGVTESIDKVSFYQGLGLHPLFAFSGGMGKR